MNVRKLNIARKKIDKLDKSIFILIKKRTNVVKYMLSLKKFKNQIVDHQRMNMPGQGFYKVLAESALRAIRICQPLRVPPTGYEKWKDLQLNFDANEMLKG